MSPMCQLRTCSEAHVLRAQMSVVALAQHELAFGACWTMGGRDEPDHDSWGVGAAALFLCRVGLRAGCVVERRGDIWGRAHPTYGLILPTTVTFSWEMSTTTPSPEAGAMPVRAAMLT
jgi:hypothetical protein